MTTAEIGGIVAEIGLPQGWARGTIGSLIGGMGIFTDGDWVESKDQDVSGEVSLIQLADIRDGTFERKSHRQLTRASAEELNCTFLRSGDVLIARMPSPLGRACIYPGLPGDAVTVVDVCIVRGASFDNRWLMHFINAPQFRDQILGKQSGSTRKRISRSNLASLELPIPPRAEQTRIADHLDALISEVRNATHELESALSKLRPYRQSVFQAAISGELTRVWRTRRRAKNSTESGRALLQKIESAGRRAWETQMLESFAVAGRKPPKNWQTKYSPPPRPKGKFEKLPPGWVWGTIEQLGEVRLGRQRSPEKAAGANQTKYVRAANITDRGVDLDDVLQMQFSPSERQKFRLKPGDILLTEASGSPEHVGRPAIWEDTPGVYCFQNTVIRFRPYHIGSAYLFRVLQAWQRLGKFAEISGGVGINHLSAGKFSKIAIPLPPLPEQREIVKLVTAAIADVDEKEALIKSLLEKSEAERSRILGEAFIGALLPQNATDGSATDFLRQIQAEHRSPAAPRSTRLGSKSDDKGRKARIMRVIDVLRAEQDWLSADKLFARCGIRDGAMTDALEEIYADLRALDKAGKLLVRRVGPTDELKLIGD